MKNRFISIMVIVCVTMFTINASAQLDRSKMPLPGPAPKINIGEYKSFTLDNGLKVFVVENHKLPRVSFNLTVDIDPIYEGADAGYTTIAGDLIGRGTTTRTKSQIDEEIDFIGATLNTSSGGISASCLKKHMDNLLVVMSDVLLNPKFSQEELDKLKKQTISGLATKKTNPNAISADVSRILVYGANHPYGEIETEKTIGNVTLDKCEGFYKTFFKPNVSYLVIVGDITFEEAKTATQKYFSAWQKGDVPKFEYKLPAPIAKNRVCYVVKEDAVQSIINISYPIILKPGTPEGIKASVMNGILGGGSFSARLFANLREKHGWTYGAYSHISSDKLVGEFGTTMQVKGNVTDSAVYEVLSEMKRINNELVDNSHLQLVINSMTGDFARSLESPTTIARFALNTARYNLPADFYTTYLEKLSKVSAEDVMAMAKQYIKPENALIIIVGPKSEAEKLKKFSAAGEIEFYDNLGNRIEESKTKKVPENITPTVVINNYANAIGGTAVLAKVKNLTIKMTMDIQGQTININTYYKAPNMFSNTVAMGDVVMQKQAYDGVTAWSMAMGKTTKSSDKETAEMKYEATMFNETMYEKWGFKLGLTGIENIDGKDVYVMEVTTPEGKLTTEYYDVTTGFKVKQVSEREAQGKVVKIVTLYSDYKDVNGIKYPHKIIQSAGGMEMIMNVTEIDTKSKLKDDIFKMK